MKKKFDAFPDLATLKRNKNRYVYHHFQVVSVGRGYLFKGFGKAYEYEGKFFIDISPSGSKIDWPKRYYRFYGVEEKRSPVVAEREIIEALGRGEWLNFKCFWASRFLPEIYSDFKLIRNDPQPGEVTPEQLAFLRKERAELVDGIMREEGIKSGQVHHRHHRVGALSVLNKGSTTHEKVSHKDAFYYSQKDLKTYKRAVTNWIERSLFVHVQIPEEVTILSNKDLIKHIKQLKTNKHGV